MAEAQLSKPAIISALAKSPHGKLAEYLPVGRQAASEDADFFAHLIAWNHRNGQVRDARAALPVIALAVSSPDEAIENALAHLADLDPRTLVRALDFAKDIKAPSRILRRLVARYLADRERRGSWARTKLQHRAVLRTLYTRYHIKPSDQANDQIVRGKPEGVFAILKTLPTLSPEAIAGTIAQAKIPFLIARGALGARAKDPDILAALIAAMSPSELVTNMKALERLDVKKVPALRAALEAKLSKTATSAKGVFKTTAAAEALADDDVLSAKLQAVQEKQIANMKGVEGDWLVIGDKSGSMAAAIETARQVSAVLATMVKGHVYLVFVDSTPRMVGDVQQATYEQIKKATGIIQAGGGTDLGTALRLMQDRQTPVDGIAVVSDGADHGRAFGRSYKAYAEKLGIEPTVYLYQTVGEGNTLSHDCKAHGIDLQHFDLRGGTVDYYSLPNLVQTMRVGRYSLLDDIYATPLARLDDVLTHTKGMGVLPRHVERTQVV